MSTMIKRFAVIDTTGRNAHSRDIRTMFSLSPGGHLPAGGHMGLCLPGMDRFGRECSVFAWIEPEPAVGAGGTDGINNEARRKSSLHRIRCECPGCGAQVSAGRLFQHVCRG